MKKFSDFINEAIIKPKIQAQRLGLIDDGHGGKYNTSGELVAKTSGDRLKFYNQGQRFGRDPKQIRTQNNQQVVATQTSVREEQDLREKYISGEIFKEGEIVESLLNGMVGKIIRRGTNHLICVTEDNVMFKSWIKDVMEYTEVKMDSSMRDKTHPNTLVGTLGAFKHYANMTPGAVGTGKENLAAGQKAYAVNFINKYKKK
jgi:hypothetical protein